MQAIVSASLSVRPSFAPNAFAHILQYFFTDHDAYILEIYIHQNYPLGDGSSHIPVHSNTNYDTPPNNEFFYVFPLWCIHTWVYP